jgi:phosphatidylglycerophosphate synthase
MGPSEKVMGAANWITISRLPLLLIYVVGVYIGGPLVKLIMAPLLLVFMLLDTVDGIVARATGTESLTGSVLDIAMDRVYYLVLCVVMADLGVIPVAIPLIVIARTTLTDALRSIGVRQGERPFEQQLSRLGRFMVGSPWMRTGYSVTKLLAFGGLTLGVALSSYPEGTRMHAASPAVLDFSVIISWLAVAFCLARGFPVILSMSRRSRGAA